MNLLLPTAIKHRRCSAVFQLIGFTGKSICSGKTSTNLFYKLLHVIEKSRLRVKGNRDNLQENLVNSQCPARKDNTKN